MLYIWGKSKFKADNQKDGWHDDDEGKKYKRDLVEDALDADLLLGWE